MKTKPFNRQIGTVIFIENEPLIYKKSTEKHLMSCVINNEQQERIPLSFFKQRRKMWCLYDSPFTQRIKRCKDNRELHSLLQGKVLQITGKSSNGLTFELINEKYW